MIRPAIALTLVRFLATPAQLIAQGQPLGPEFRVNTYVTSYQLLPSVASDTAGNFVVAWTSAQDGSFGGIFAQRYASSGTPLGGEFRVNTFTTNYQLLPSVASDAAGNFVIAWTSVQDGDSYGVFARRYASSGTPLGGEFQVNTHTPNVQREPAVASDAAGNFVVAWPSSSQDGSGFGVFAQRYASTGAPLGAEFRVNTFTPDYQLSPAVACDPAGNFVIAWASRNQDGSGFGIYAQRYASTGAPLGGGFRVSTYTPNHQLAPRVASDAAGNFVISWGSDTQDGSNRGAFAQRYASTGAPLGGEFQVNSYTTGYQSGGSVASDTAGNFVVTWRSGGQDGSGLGIFGQRYSSTGTPVGGEFRINTYTTNAQTTSAVASDPAGHFVVVWSSLGQDGSDYGVFGQRYSTIVPVELQSFQVD